MTFQEFLAAMGLHRRSRASRPERPDSGGSRRAAQADSRHLQHPGGSARPAEQGPADFREHAAQQLGSFLSSLGDTNYTPTMAALLGQGAERTSNYNNYQTQQDLWNSLIGGSGLMAQMPSLRDQIRSRFRTSTRARLRATCSARSTRTTATTTTFSIRVLPVRRKRSPRTSQPRSPSRRSRLLTRRSRSSASARSSSR